MFFSPLEQFIVRPFSPFKTLGGSKIYVNTMDIEIFCMNHFGFYPFLDKWEDFPYFTPTFIYTSFSCILFLVVFYVPCYLKKVYPSTVMELLVEKAILLIQDIINQSFVSKRRYENFIPFLTFTFYFILFSNILGLMPFGFTTTSFIVPMFILSSTFLIVLTVFGIGVQGVQFFEHFIPKGVPLLLIPMLVIIEIISYIAKAFSLSIRLFANMMSGHTLLNILSSFTLKLSKVSLILGSIPCLIVIAVYVLEIGISTLQAYVFMVLLTLYFNDSFSDIKNFEKYKKVYNWKIYTF